MVPRRQSDPGCELAPRSEWLRRWGLHHQQRRADRADAGDLGETPAAFVSLVPGHEFAGDLGDLLLKLSMLFGLGREQLARQVGHALISLNAFEQRSEVRQPVGGSEPELGGVAAD